MESTAICSLAIPEGVTVAKASEKSAIAVGVARQQSDTAIYRSVTGTYPKKKMHRTRPAR